MNEQTQRPGRRGQRTAVVALLARRQRWTALTLVAIAAVALGAVIGRVSAPSPQVDARRAIEASALPLALDADGIWTSSADGRSPVSEALVALRRDGDATLVADHLGDWLAAYDVALARLADVALPPPARPVQRQLITAVTFSRDATEVLGHAASLDDEVARRDLTTEAGRLRTRSEQVMQSARASMVDMEGSETEVGPLPALRSFLEARRP